MVNNLLKCVLIDFDNTLIDFNACSKKAVIKGFKTFGIDYKDSMFEKFIEINNSLWDKIELGTLTKEELHEIRWVTVFKALGIEKDGIAFEDIYVENLSSTVCYIDGAIDLLKYLSSKYTLYTGTNGSAFIQHRRMKAFGLDKYIKKAYISDEIGHAKPSAEYFNACCNDIGITDLSEIIMIGDSLFADINGAKNYGIKTIWYNYYNKENTSDIVPDYCVKKLCEIKNII